MKKSRWVRLAMLFLVISTLSGCIWAIEDDGYGHGGGRGGGRGGGGQHDEHHERR